jgi:Tfp pilus assembly protein FimT
MRISLTVTRRGFTYIELSVVMLMMMLLAALVTPRFASFVRARELTGFRDGLTWMVGQARETAIGGGQSVDLQYDEGNNQMQIVATNSGSDDTAPLRVLKAPDGVTATRFQSDAGTNNSTAWSVRFYPDGTASAAGIEFTVGRETYSLVVGAYAGAETVDGDMPDLTTNDWEAGDYVHRTE